MKRFLDPKVRIGIACFLFVASLIAWPVLALTIAKDEPQVVLGLSFLALLYTSYDVIATEIAGMKAGDDDA